MKRRILLVDDEVAVLLTLKAVLEISGFDVDTATSAREGKARIKHREYDMVITDMRMEDEHAGSDVIAAAKEAAYSPAIALLTAFPVDDEALSTMGADKMLVKPMHTRILLQQLESLMTRHIAAKEKAAAKKAAPEKRSTPVDNKPVRVVSKSVKTADSPVKSSKPPVKGQALAMAAAGSKSKSAKATSKAAR